MHRGQRLERATIAKWVGRPFEEKELFEPINVLWVDPAASSEVAALDSVVAFLDKCDFKREGDYLFGTIPGPRAPTRRGATASGATNTIRTTPGST